MDLGIIKYRAVNSEELSFIYSTWLKSYSISGANCFNDNHLYYKYQRMLIDKLLGQSSVLVAEVDGEVLGYIVFEIKTPFLMIHWAYVKKTFRGMGIYQAMLNRIRGLFDWGTERIIVTALGDDYYYDRGGGSIVLKKPYFNWYIYMPGKAFE